MDVLTLLQKKNRCLERFLEISSQFLAQARGGSLDGLAQFEKRRDSTLKTMQLFDRKITETVIAMDDCEKTPSLSDSVKALLATKERLVHDILAADLEILSMIEEAKTNLIRDLSSAQKSKELVGKFKSTWMPQSGEELDAKL